MSTTFCNKPFLMEIRRDFASFVAAEAVRSAQMDTNERLRQRALRLVSRGVNQKALASAMGMTQGTFSKWLRNKPGIKPPTVAALDGFERFARDLASDLQEETSRDHASTAGGLQRTGTDKRSVNLGPPSGIPDRRRHG
jgi:hypothetical protein